MSRHASKRYTKKDVLKAIEKSYNNTSTVAKRLGVSWHTAERLINKWPDTIKAFNDELEIINDEAQSQAYELIKKQDRQMICWWLSKKAKSRGFGDDNKTGVNFNYSAGGNAQNGDFKGPILQIEIIDDPTPNNALNAILEASEDANSTEGTAQNED